MCATKDKEKVMISQPMVGKTREEIIAVRNKAIDYLTKAGYEIEDTLFGDGPYDELAEKTYKQYGVNSVPLFYMALALKAMSYCHAVYFCKGWENARGCRIEHAAAIAYGLEVIYE